MQSLLLVFNPFLASDDNICPRGLNEAATVPAAGFHKQSAKSPYVLHCGHTFCAHCLVALPYEHGGVSCPLCSQLHTTSDRRTPFPVNYALRNLLASLQQQAPGEALEKPDDAGASAPAQENHRFATVRVTTDSILRRQIGSAITFDLVDFNQVDLVLQVPRTNAIAQFKRQFATEHSIPLKYVGHFYAHHAAATSTAYPLLRALCGLPQSTPIAVSEEIKRDPRVMCDGLDVEDTFKEAELRSGDILVVQRDRGAEGQPPHISAQEYLETIKTQEDHSRARLGSAPSSAI
ncbi:hypothetical protein WJX73_005995 [Symbiochloris irregularis]|uniref:RING-type domain-containing protein n=1 Tax=Symbiochloris irregularis TaxID=706552 RepID=A0AAW1PIC2_9CHLO